MIYSLQVSLISLSVSYRTDKNGDETGNETKILAAVIEKLLDQSGPSLVTLKIQFHFAKHYRDRGCFSIAPTRFFLNQWMHVELLCMTEIFFVSTNNCFRFILGERLLNSTEVELLFLVFIIVNELCSGWAKRKLEGFCCCFSDAMHSFFYTEQCINGNSLNF